MSKYFDDGFLIIITLYQQLYSKNTKTMNCLDHHKSDLKTLLLAICQLHEPPSSTQLSPPPIIKFYQEYIQSTLLPNDKEINLKQHNKIDDVLVILLKNITEIAIDWIDLLVNDGISSETQAITINRPPTLTKLYQGLMLRVQQQTLDILKQSTRQQKTFQELYIDNTCLALIAQIFNTFAQAIASCFQYGKSIITKNADEIDSKIKSSDCINSYIVFAMLKQIATETEILILQRIDKIFPNLPLAKCSQFCKYIQKNYQIASLVCIESGKNYIYTRAQMIKYQEEKNKKWLNYIHYYLFCKDVKISKIQSMSGENGILLQRKSSSFRDSKNIQMENIEKEGENSTCEENNDQQANQKGQNEKFILKVQQGKEIKIINAKVCQQSWRIFDSKDSLTDLYETFEKQIETTGKKKNKDFVSYGVPTCEFATIGGSLGKCLADINKYHSANQFFVDLSKDAAICTAFSAAMTEVPILSYFIIAGGLSYSFYMTCKNQATSKDRKANQMGSATFTAFMSIGSTVGGILLGQTIIPVPFVGAFFGGVAGAFLGTKGARHVNQVIAKTSFKETISYMKAKIVQDRYWQATEYMLERIGLDKKYFDNNTPKNQNSKDTFITAICFCIITFYQSKRYMDFNDRKMKEIKQKQKQNQKIKQKQKQLSSKQGQIRPKSQKNNEKLQNAGVETFQNQFNLVAIVDYLSHEKFSILQKLDVLSNFIMHIVK